MSFQEKIQYTITNAKFIEDENGADGRGDRHVQFDIIRIKCNSTRSV